MAVEGWTGWHGQGKTYCAVDRALRGHLKTGVEIWTNADVAGSRHFDTWDELMALIENAHTDRSRAIVLVDEAGKFLSSRFFQKMDPRVLTLLQERRKVGRGVDLWWTAPSLRHVDVQLRDVTHVIHRCRRYGGSEYSHDGGRAPWAFRELGYRPDDLSSDTYLPRRGAKPMCRRWVPFSSDFAALYGTAVLDMSKPMAAAVNSRPDYRGQGDGVAPEPGPAAVVLEVARAGRR